MNKYFGDRQIERLIWYFIRAWQHVELKRENKKQRMESFIEINNEQTNKYEKNCCLFFEYWFQSVFNSRQNEIPLKWTKELHNLPWKLVNISTEPEFAWLSGKNENSIETKRKSAKWWLWISLQCESSEFVWVDETRPQ